MRTAALLYINGIQHAVPAHQARLMLADYLRQVASLQGTKIVCAEGDCGACTVLGLLPFRKEYVAINSCILTVAQLDGASLITVDSLAAGGGGLTPVQSAMMSCHGSQCGFCTPGFVMALTGLVEKKLAAGKSSQQSGISAREAKNALTGNLCRCTGYQPILDAATAIDLKACASLQKRPGLGKERSELARSIKTPLLLDSTGARSASAAPAPHEVFSFYAPTRLSDAVKYLTLHKDARVVGAATDVGVRHNKWVSRLEHNVSLHLIPELSKIKTDKKRITVGARVTLSELRQACLKKHPELARFLDLFASPQIKNVATLVGNVANASPIADTPPFLLVSGARVHAQSTRGKRIIAIEKFFLGYRKTALKPGELITAIDFELPTRSESLALSKISQRKDLDISAINSAIRFKWKDTRKQEIQEARIALGGVAATTVRLRKTEAALKGPTRGALERALKELEREIRPIDDLRGSAVFRRILAENLLKRFFVEHAPR